MPRCVGDQSICSSNPNSMMKISKFQFLSPERANHIKNCPSRNLQENAKRGYQNMLPAPSTEASKEEVKKRSVNHSQQHSSLSNHNLLYPPLPSPPLSSTRLHPTATTLLPWPFSSSHPSSPSRHDGLSGVVSSRVWMRGREEKERSGTDVLHEDVFKAFVGG